MDKKEYKLIYQSSSTFEPDRTIIKTKYFSGTCSKHCATKAFNFILEDNKEIISINFILIDVDSDKIFCFCGKRTKIDMPYEINIGDKKITYTHDLSVKKTDRSNCKKLLEYVL